MDPHTGPRWQVIHWWETALQHGGNLMIDDFGDGFYGQDWARIVPPPSEFEKSRDIGAMEEEPAGTPELRRTLKDYFDMYDSDGGGTMNEVGELMGTTTNLVVKLSKPLILKKKFSKAEVRLEVQAIPLGEKLEWDFDQFCRWFVHTFMPNSYDPKGAPPDDAMLRIPDEEEEQFTKVLEGGKLQKEENEAAKPDQEEEKPEEETPPTIAPEAAKIIQAQDDAADALAAELFG